MALPPTVPTSFVPHSLSATTERSRPEMMSVFSLFSYVILFIIFLLAVGVFLYGRILSSERNEKDAALVSAEKYIDSATVEGFVRLRDRLNFSTSMLDTHVSFSNFFSTLSVLMPVPSRFSALHVSIDSFGVVHVEGAGIAKNFNALAAVSTAVASDDRIKDAIFSKININKDRSVSFNFSAVLDPKLLAYMSETAPLSSTTTTASSTPLP